MSTPNAGSSTPTQTILIVDDTAENLEVMYHVLAGQYRVKMASSGHRALAIAAQDPLPDLVLLDVSMPGMDGYAVCRALKADARTAVMPVIFVTANALESNQQTGLACGAVDYVTKPFNPALLQARIRNHLLLKQAADLLRQRGDELEQQVAQRTHELVATRDAAILAMASLAETRDNETGNHIRRTQRYVKALAEEMAGLPHYAQLLTPAYIELLQKSAPLHDIGKVGVPDHILLKPGKLTPEEFEIMKRHPDIGRQAIEKAEEDLGMPIEFLRIAKEIAASHHEKWDGSGYPHGLKGQDIPLAARLMAIADVYDALISQRPYKQPMSHEAAVELIHVGRGTHFDPEVVDAFDRCVAAFRAIAARFADDGNDLGLQQLPQREAA